MATRLHSVENLVATTYAAPEGTVVKGATVTATIATTADNAQEDTLYALFVTPAQLESADALTALYPGVVDWAAMKPLFDAQGFSAKAGSATVVNTAGKPIIVLGLSATPTLATLRTAAQTITTKARDTKRKNVVVYFPNGADVIDITAVKLGFGKGVKGTSKSNVPTATVGGADVIDVIVRGLLYTNWAHDLFLKDQIFAISNITLVGQALDIKAVHNAVHGGESTTLAREVGSLRFSVANNTYMKDKLVALAAANPDVFSIKVVERKQLEADGYGLICAVNQGSWDQCYLVAIEYTPPGFVVDESEDNRRPYSFVAKTLTFDTGGYDLKPAAGMLDMHCDKHAGCNQLGLFRFLGLTRPQTSRKIVGVWTITDNEIGSKAVHPHTIVPTTSIHGYTMSVAIDNTDAEGRLALADAVTFVQKTYNPIRITTSATLTGAVLVSLGHYMTGLFTNSPYLTEDITRIAQRNGEPMWLLPLIQENYKDLAGKDCTIKNITGSRFMGSSVAAAFIDEFVGDDVEFMHLDIAGTSSTPGNEAAGTPCTTLQHLANSLQKQ